MPKPVAVITGDVHFTLQTLDLATEVIKQCLAKAKELNVPLILNGDTLDGKAIVRGEVMNRLIELLDQKDVQVIVNVGNHDKVNEKSEDHCLNFLSKYCTVVNGSLSLPARGFSIISYQHDHKNLLLYLTLVSKDLPVIVHQGVMGADLGHYVQDKTSLSPEAFKDFRVIASHYHKRQDIVCGELGPNMRGLFSYTGNPYTLTFGESGDGPKGFSVLMDDGSLEFVPTNLRKHVIFEEIIGTFQDHPTIAKDDLLWVKAKGPKSELTKLNKDTIGKWFLGHANIKLDLIPTDSDIPAPKTETMTDGEVLDSLIDTLGEPDTQKSFLKSLWRGLVE